MKTTDVTLNEYVPTAQIPGRLAGRTITRVETWNVRWDDEETDALAGIRLVLDDGTDLVIQNDEAPFSIDVGSSSRPARGA